MSAALGGRAAEQLVFDKISTGALNDLEKITKQAYAMVSYFGMSDKIGNLSFYDSSGQRDFTFTKPYSEKTAELIDKEAQEYVYTAYQRAYEILKNHREELDQLAEMLLEKEIIFSDDLEKILGKREIDDEKKQKILEEGKKVKKIHEESEKQRSEHEKEEKESSDKKEKEEKEEQAKTEEGDESTEAQSQTEAGNNNKEEEEQEEESEVSESHKRISSKFTQNNKNSKNQDKNK
jgi:cell division protease FtsH